MRIDRASLCVLAHAASQAMERGEYAVAVRDCTRGLAATPGDEALLSLLARAQRERLLGVAAQAKLGRREARAEALEQGLVAPRAAAMLV